MLIVKVGGAKNIDWDLIAADLKNILEREQVVLVHGASQTRDDIAKTLDAPSETVVSPSGVSSVFTNRRAMEIFLMAYSGLVNKLIVENFQGHGINAIGLSGVDGRIWEGKRKDRLLVKEGEKIKVRKGNLTGRVEKVNTGLITNLVQEGYVPVICPPAISYEKELINVDNDLAIAVMARELGVKNIVVLFEAGGLLEDLSDPHSLVKKINKEEIEKFYDFAKGRMKKKIMGAKEALDNGAEKLYWGPINIDSPITKAIEGGGTIIS
ncbi:[LysW]-aminoadipate kinase [Candidatus Dojkabacteria bacterium]|nr:[LysW]-aminoadipate kinase [Candidatus Dojkabacteria bacterium]